MSPVGRQVSSIQGTLVLINSGGAAGSGSGCNPTAPQAAVQADQASNDAQAGSSNTTAQKRNVVVQSVSSPTALALTQAAATGEPFVAVTA